MLPRQYNIAPYAKAAAKLLQGALFEDQKDLWELLLHYQSELSAYFEQIALELVVDTRDGGRGVRDCAASALRADGGP